MRRVERLENCLLCAKMLIRIRDVQLGRSPEDADGERCAIRSQYTALSSDHRRYWIVFGFCVPTNTAHTV